MRGICAARTSRLRFAALLAAACFCLGSHAQAPANQIIVDPDNASWLVRSGAGPFFLAGPGDPEDFLYRGVLNADGTRTGDQDEIITKLAEHGGNAVYIQAIRSHGGDGDATHNPFIGHDPEAGLNPAVLNQWDAWFERLEDAGIAICFFFFDDSARVWAPEFPDSFLGGIRRWWSDWRGEVTPAERRFVADLVDRFEHRNNIVWVVAEEYSEAFSPKAVSNIAEVIAEADDYDHPVAVHKLSGIDFSEFANDPHIDQFAIQYNDDVSVDGLHSAVVEAWHDAAGRYNLNLAEAALGDAVSGEALRRRLWAAAMGGAYVMVFQMDVVSTPESDLRQLRRLAEFMESTDFNRMEPSDELAGSGTDYVLAQPGISYIAYTGSAGESMQVRGVPPGRYEVAWLDIAGGARLQQDASVAEGETAATLRVPQGPGAEIAAYIRKIDP